MSMAINCPVNTMLNLFDNPDMAIPNPNMVIRTIFNPNKIFLGQKCSD